MRFKLAAEGCSAVTIVFRECYTWPVRMLP